MPDMTLAELQDTSHKVALEHGWWQKPRPIPELLCLMHSEISEALEEYRDDPNPEKLAAIRSGADGRKPEGFWIEIADLLIRVADMAEAQGVDLAHYINVKMEYNRTRPFRHGGKAV